MKHFISCYLVHLGTATAVSLFLWGTGILGNILVSEVPLFKTYLVVLLQVVLAVPFCKLFPKYYADKTTLSVPENGQIAYYSSFLLVHSVSIYFIYLLFRGYFTFLSIKDEIIGEISGFAASSEMYADVLGGMHIFDGFLDSMVTLVNAAPDQIMNYLDRMILGMAFYSVVVFALMTVIEYLRVKSCDGCEIVKKPTTYTYNHR